MEYEKSSFYILGPDVWCENDLKEGWKGHQSPAYPWEYTRSYLYWQSVYFKSYLEFLSLKGRYRKIKYFLIRIINGVIGRTLKICMRTVYKKHRLFRHENIPIQGSCIILSDKFLKKEDNLFTPETKFYGEEILLYLKQKKWDVNIIYNPELQVCHMQGRATAKLGGNCKRNIFVSRNIVESNRIILECFKN